MKVRRKLSSATSDRARAPQDIAGFDPLRTAGDCTYDHRAAEHAADWFPSVLVHVKGPLTGSPIKLSPWEDAVTRTLFGWKRPDGRRRFQRSYIELPRKNGKSTWLAGTIAYCLFCDPQSDQGGELYSAAATAEQSGLVFGMVASMIQKVPWLLLNSKISRSVRRINRLKNGVLGDTFYRGLPAEAAQAHGFNASVIASDELHAWKGREFYDTLQTSQGSRAEPLSIDITTAGYDRETICWLQHEYAIKVRDGLIDDDAFLPVLYFAGEDEDWTDPAVWRKANPNLGISVSEDYLKRECARAKESPSYVNSFRRLHLNQWTQASSRFLDMSKWRGCASAYREEDLHGSMVYGGLDLSHNTDITAWVLCFPLDGGGYRILPRLFIPEGAADRISRKDRVPYLQWAEHGHVHLTPGDSIDRDYVHAQIMADCGRFDLRQIGYDPWSADATRVYLESEGLECVEMRQGARTFTAPLKELERAIIAGEFEHDDNPCLNWQAESLEVYTDPNGNIRPVKPRFDAHSRKIDGMVALTMAMGLALIRPEAPHFSASNLILV